MMRPEIRVAAIAVVAAMFLAGSAHAAAKNVCAAKKILSVSKTVKATFMCASKQAAGKLDSSGYDGCVLKAVLKQGKEFTKAEKAGACSGSSAACAYVNGQCKLAAASVIDTEQVALQPVLWKIVAKYESARLGCASKFYKGGDAASLATCNAAAAAAVASKTEDSGATADPTGIILVLTNNCDAGVYADAPDTAKICRLCSETHNAGTVVGCAEGDADDIVEGVADATAQFSSSNPTVTFQAVSPDKTYCDGNSGACVATGPSTIGDGCCSLTVDGQPACHVGPSAGTATCIALAGGPNYTLGASCVDGTCVGP